MKISLITVLYNGEAFLKECIESVIHQTYKNIEYIVIDGGSTDRSLSIINHYKKHINYFISEKDKGLYDAINKGISVSTGDVVGILNADDVLAGEYVIDQIAAAFKQNPDIDGTYGDLNYVYPVSLKIIRKWKSRQANRHDIKSGWMPAHPTLYLKKNLFEKHGNYALDMGTAADYDLILRFFHTHEINALYLPVLMVNMRTGGVSNKSIKSLLAAFMNDYKSLKRNKIPFSLFVLLKKKFSKLAQFKK
ncbi:glycosyltransferase family 2 protein [Pedobacter rhodius]|uniref:Glycosyltransferase family 2 protein n=1 Tax=Pedobacter rhodius TaxID=3004098 RepID=A0ABT4KSC1_9SPHI|nr:glycosyltransferase family 2 protein [Pedobacter sp. SJ11]MCZ4221827.1 glycosyltransferase family 2 protein [Pedobacter sp. SJ11]